MEKNNQVMAKDSRKHQQLYDQNNFLYNFSIHFGQLSNGKSHHQCIIESQIESIADKEDPISSKEFKAVEKVIHRLKNKLAYYGINIDDILKDINDLENEGKIIEVGTKIPLEDLTIIPYENIYVQNDNN